MLAVNLTALYDVVRCKVKHTFRKMQAQKKLTNFNWYGL